MASSIIDSATNHIRDFLLEESKGLYFVKDEVVKLEGELMMMQLLLREAEKIQCPSESFLTYVFRIRDCAYEAEDIVEKYQLQVRHKRPDGVLNTVKWLRFSCYDMNYLRELKTDIKNLLSKLDILCSQRNMYGLESFHNDGDLHLSRYTYDINKTYPHITDDTIFSGDDVAMLVDKLLEYQVIGIFGMGGLGKSTIAKKVFKESISRAQFQRFAWVYVSQKFDRSSILRTILLKLYHDEETEVELIRQLQDHELVERVCEALQRHKCLIVFDDFWSIDDWNCLKPALNSLKSSSSTLLITTRCRDVLPHMDSDGFIYQLQCFSDAESWELFKYKTRQWRHQPDDGMWELARGMVNRCGGLPMAIAKLSEILATKTSVEEWRVVEKNLHLVLNTGFMHMGPTLSQILELSYFGMPPNLRPCFLYMAVFPKGSKIPFERLFHLWEAEGLLKLPSWNGVVMKGVTTKDIAIEYLNKMVNYSVVQVEERSGGGKIKTCSLHSMMWDLCVVKAVEETFLDWIVEGEQWHKSSGTKSKKLMHRLSIQLGEGKLLWGILSEIDRLRSLICFASDESSDEYRNSGKFLKGLNEVCPVLRILDMEGIYVSGFPNDITDLRYLRFLSFKGTCVTKLPSSFAKLKCLLVLDLRVVHPESSEPIQIPNDLTKLDRLKHLYLPNSPYVCHDGDKLTLGGCSSLETLVGFRPESCLVESLNEMHELRKLSFNSHFQIREDLQILRTCPYVKSRRSLTLSIAGELVQSPNAILLLLAEDLYPNGLQFTGKFGMLDFKKDVKFLVLHSCQFDCDPMPYLEKMSELRCLCLDECLNPGVKQLNCSDGGFPQLTALVLSKLKSTKELIVGSGAMPNLVRVSMEGCFLRISSRVSVDRPALKISYSPCSSLSYMKGSPTVQKFRTWVKKL